MSTRVGNVEVGHGTMAVVLQLVDQSSRAVVLTPDMADRLALVLVRQAAYARLTEATQTDGGTQA